MSDEKMKDWLTEGDLQEMRPRDPETEVVRVLIGRKKYETMLDMALAALKQSPEAEGAGEVPKLAVQHLIGMNEPCIVLAERGHLTEAEAAEVIRRVEAHDTLAADNARMREVIRIQRDAALGDAEFFISPSIKEAMQTRASRLSKVLETTPASPWLTEKLRETALRAAEAALESQQGRGGYEYPPAELKKRAASVVDGLKLGEL